MSIPEHEIIKALADNRLRVADAARAMYMHRNSILYRTSMIQKKTGLDPLDFWDMQELIKLYEIEKG